MIDVTRGLTVYWARVLTDSIRETSLPFKTVVNWDDFVEAYIITVTRPSNNKDPAVLVYDLEEGDIWVDTNGGQHSRDVRQLVLRLRRVLNAHTNEDLL